MKKTILVEGIKCRHCQNDIQDVLLTFPNIQQVNIEKNIVTVILTEYMDDQELIENIENCGNFTVAEIK